MLEQAIVSGIAHDTGEAKVTILGVPDQPGVAGRVFRPLADAGINIDMIVQNVSAAGHTDISFTLPTEHVERAEPILASLADSVGAAGLQRRPRHRQGLGRRRRDAEPSRASRPTSSRRSPTPGSTSRSSRPRRSASRASCRADEAERAVNVIHERLRLADDVYYDTGDDAAA